MEIPTLDRTGGTASTGIKMFANVHFSGNLYSDIIAPFALSSIACEQPIVTNIGYLRCIDTSMQPKRGYMKKAQY